MHPADSGCEMCVANLFFEIVQNGWVAYSIIAGCGGLDAGKLMLGAWCLVRCYWVEGREGRGKDVIGYMRGGEAGNTFDAEEKMRKAESGVVQSCVQEGMIWLDLGSKSVLSAGWVTCQVMWWAFIAWSHSWMDQYGSSGQVCGEYIAEFLGTEMPLPFR